MIGIAIISGLLLLAAMSLVFAMVGLFVYVIFVVISEDIQEKKKTKGRY